MIKINIVAVGRVKEKYYKEAIAEYSKMLSRFCEVKITEVEEENYKKVDTALIERIKDIEGDRILPNLKGYVISMAIEGKKFTSQTLSKKIKELIDNGHGIITFVIGGSYGIADSIKAKSNMLLSFSDMTFPHTLFRVILTEQLYRSFSIIFGSTYDK